MPRVKFKGGVTAAKLTRDQTIEELLADPWGVLHDGENHALLAPFTLAERAEILRTVERKRWAEREAARLPVLLERLRTWPPDSWGDVFAERPDLERTLTAAQRAQWVGFVRENRARLRAQGVKLQPDANFDAHRSRKADAPPAPRPRLVGKDRP
jgi:hypothetical protein